MNEWIYLHWMITSVKSWLKVHSHETPWDAVRVARSGVLLKTHTSLKHTQNQRHFLLYCKSIGWRATSMLGQRGNDFNFKARRVWSHVSHDASHANALLYYDSLFKDSFSLLTFAWIVLLTRRSLSSRRGRSPCWRRTTRWRPRPTRRPPPAPAPSWTRRSTTSPCRPTPSGWWA